MKIDKEPYLTRRERLMEQCQDGLIFVRGAGAEGLNPNFRYLTGLEEPRAALLLSPAGSRVETGRLYPGPDYVRGRLVKQILFLPAPDPLAARWGESSPINTESVALEEAGVEAVFTTGQIDGVLSQALLQATTLHYIGSRLPSLEDLSGVDSAFVSKLRNLFLNLEIRDATAAVSEMRRLKDAEEIGLIREALAVVEEALDVIVRTVRPGMYEYEVEAMITRIYRGRGAQHAFDPIVACGANALALHYAVNSARIEAGQLLLIDTGAAVGGYHADITRTYPVDGKFTERQREIYEAVLSAEQAVISNCKPGALIEDLHSCAYKVIEETGYAEEFVHGIGHHLGLETHDVGDMYSPLAPGAVITVEPGIYHTASQIGVRIEDDVLITQAGSVVLSEAIPREAEEIEQRRLSSD